MLRFIFRIKLTCFIIFLLQFLFRGNLSMKILGINGSGRKEGYSSQICLEMMEASGVEHELISLSGMNIGGCRACLGCAKDNRCVLNDDFNRVLDKVYEANLLIFAGPSYFGTLNAISLAFWERTFSQIHRGAFPLSGKLGFVIGLTREEDGSATKRIKGMMESNNLAVIGTYQNGGRTQCYECGFGHDCTAGSVYKNHGLCTAKFARENRPMEYLDDQEAQDEVKAKGKLIGSILRAQNQ